MATNTDVTADAVSRAIAALFGVGQVGIDWASVVRALLAFREEERQRWLDANDELSATPRHTSTDIDLILRKANAGSDGAALWIEVQGGLLASVLRMGSDWQRLLQDSAPALKQAANDYQAHSDPSPAATEALVNQIVIFTQIVGEFLRDQGAQLERELLVLQAEVPGRNRPEPAVRSQRRVKA